MRYFSVNGEGVFQKGVNTIEDMEKAFKEVNIPSRSGKVFSSMQKKKMK